MLPMSARISCDGQSGLNGFALAMAYQAPKGAYLQFRMRELTLQAMWKNTEVTRRLKLDVPIVQGPFGSGLSAVDLVVAVSEGGGLGSFGVHHLDGAGIRAIDAQIRARTQRTFALNLWIPLGDSDDPQVTDAQWSAASICCGRTSTSCACRCRRGQRASGRTTRSRSKPCWSCDRRCSVSCSACRALTYSSVAEAPASRRSVPPPRRRRPKLLEDAGVDMIVASGFEAGGHRVSFLREPEECLTGTLALIPQVVDTVKVPVIAAGGIADGRGIAAALKLRRVRGADRYRVPRLRGIECLAAASREAVQRRCAPHDAHASFHRTTGAQHSQRTSSMRFAVRKARSRRIRCRPGSPRNSRPPRSPRIAPT